MTTTIRVTFDNSTRVGEVAYEEDGRVIETHPIAGVKWSQRREIGRRYAEDGTIKDIFPVGPTIFELSMVGHDPED